MPPSRKRPADIGMRLWQQRSSNATTSPSAVLQNTSTFSQMTSRRRTSVSNSSEKPALYQAFRIMISTTFRSSVLIAMPPLPAFMMGRLDDGGSLPLRITRISEESAVALLNGLFDLPDGRLRQIGDRRRELIDERRELLPLHPMRDETAPMRRVRVDPLRLKDHLHRVIGTDPRGEAAVAERNAEQIEAGETENGIRRGNTVIAGDHKICARADRRPFDMGERHEGRRGDRLQHRLDLHAKRCMIHPRRARHHRAIEPRTEMPAAPANDKQLRCVIIGCDEFAHQRRDQFPVDRIGDIGPIEVDRLYPVFPPFSLNYICAHHRYTLPLPVQSARTSAVWAPDCAGSWKIRNSTR